jgi:hypothetical protein
MAVTPSAERPSFLPGYGLQAVDHDTTTFAWANAEEHLSRSRNYWIVSVRSSGRPHAMPVWGVWVDAALLFSTDVASVKGRNLIERPEIVAHLESGDDVVILEGRAQVVRDRAVLEPFVEAYDAKYGIRVDIDNPAFTVFALRPSRALTWVEKDFPGTATRWRLQAAGA